MYFKPLEDKIQRWYFGTVASAAAVCLTHPLDLMKVVLQTQQDNKLSIVQMTAKIIKQDGPLKLYNGISASLARQLIYSTARFSLYEVGKHNLPKESGFKTRIALAGSVGAACGFVGVPADLIKVRMLNDIKLPLDQRRNYKNVIKGWVRVNREEGFGRLFSGASIATGRSFFMTICQILFYDEVESLLLDSGHFKEDTKTHFLSFLIAAVIGTTLTQPLDVLKTRAMNAKPSEFKSLKNLFWYTVQPGPLSFYKGYFPAILRLGPHTVISFLLLEKLRSNFGY